MGKIGKIGKIGRRGWGLMIFFARTTRGLRRPSLEARSGSPSRPPSREGKTSKLGGGRGSSHTGHPSCLQNAHDKNVLVRRTQSRINQAAPPKRMESEWVLRGSGGLLDSCARATRGRCPPRWTRAEGDQTSSPSRERRKSDSRWTRAVKCSLGRFHGVVGRSLVVDRA